MKVKGQQQARGKLSPRRTSKGCDEPVSPPPTDRLENTPTHSPYKQPCDDLRELRQLGAETNTAAGEGAAMKAASPSPAALAVTARVRELREAEEQDRRDRQIAAIARLLQRAAGDSRRAEGRK